MASRSRWAKLADLARHLAYRQEWMPLPEAARLYRVTPDTMLIWVRQECFTSRIITNEIWISREELESALRRRPGQYAETNCQTH